MKKYLYGIYWREADEPFDRIGWKEDIPEMPKVLAEKTAKTINKICRKRDRKVYFIRKSEIATKEASPAKAQDWFAYYFG